jgi:fatty acid desaturase
MSANTPIRLSDIPEEFRVISVWRGSFDVARSWLAIMLLVVVCGILQSLWVDGVAMMLIAGFQNHLMVLWHHSIHHNLHPSRRVNNAIARWFLIAPMGQPWGMMRRAHINHHAQLGNEPDADRWYYDLNLHGRRRPWVLIGWLLVNCMGGLLWPQIRKVLTGRRDANIDPGTETEEGNRYDQFSVVLCQAALFAVFWLLGQAWWSYFAFWALPLVTLGGGLNCLRTALEHADPDVPPHLKFSFVSNPIERFFVAPFQMNYHWEHHLLLTVPYYKMPQLRSYLQAHRQYGEGRLLGTYLERLREVFAKLAKV